jgi:hypothetical protein
MASAQLNAPDRLRPDAGIVPAREELTLPSVLFVEAREEQRCRDHLLTGQSVTLSGVTPSGRRRQLSGVVSGMHRGSTLHPGYPLMVTIRERLGVAQE